MYGAKSFSAQDTGWKPVLLATAWLLTIIILASRNYLLMPYAATSLLTPGLEPFGTPTSLLLLSASLAGLWFWLAGTGIGDSDNRRRAFIAMSIACIPGMLWLVRLAGLTMLQPMFVEILWLAGWTGISFGYLAADRTVPQRSKPGRLTKLINSWSTPLIIVALLACGCWWFYQAWYYHHSYLMGFNDYGHFLQRIANTAARRGVLLESPVLPAFWDHFNPGLLLLVPIWQLWPDVHQAFLWQAACLAGSAYLIFRLSLAMRSSRSVALVWALAWLVQPSVGQMNLAYSYGWHPITLAIPLLLGAMLALLNKRIWLATVCCVVAMSMEEGVLVIVTVSAGCFGLLRWINLRWSPKPGGMRSANSQLVEALPMVAWFATSIISAVTFVLVFKFSGLAEFQTGRFVALGNSTTEVLLSPLLRPVIFWGSLFSWDRWAYVLLLWLPCSLPALVRGWQYLLPSFLPLGVLLVWDHAPAHCIAFQYPSILLPLFWMAALSGAHVSKGAEDVSELKYPVTAFATGILLCMFVGQMPYSLTTLMDVDGRTYDPASLERRRLKEEDNIWLTEQVAQIRQQQLKCLATGRIAAHLVGMPDIETVGQYVQRRELLSRLPDRLDHPLKHYDVILLDRQEGFQQSRDQIEAVQIEAEKEGFIEIVSRYDIVVLKQP